MNKQGSLAACIAKMYEGGTLDSTASSGHGTPAKKVCLNPTNSMSAMDRKLSLLDSKVEKLVNNQGEVLMKLDVVYQGIGNLEKGLGKLKQLDDPVSSTEKKSEQIQFSEIKALCTETVKLLKSLQLDATKQKEKIDKMDNTMSAVDKVIRFVGETFKSSKVVEYILKGMVPWRKVSLLDEKREELEEPNAKLKTGVHNRGIQAEIKRFPEAVEKTLPDESISSDDILHLQSLNQVEEKQKNANLSGEKPTKSKNLDLKKDTASPLATAEHDHKPSRKTKEVTIKSREPTRSQTFDNDTYDISVTSSNCDASSSNKEETKNASLSVTSVHSEPLFSETNHQSKQATISSLESSSDTGRKTSSVLDEEHTTETIPVTQSNQVNLKASKMYAESIKTILEKQTERRTSLKPEGTSSKRKDSSIKKESSTPLTKSSCLSKPKNEQKPVAQDSKMSGMQQKDGNLLKQLSLEKSINEPHKEQDNQMKDSDPGGHEKEAGENSDAVRNCEEQPKAELLEAKSCTETTQKASLIVIDDSPPLPAPFEHRIVSAKQMPVTTCYSVSQHEVLGGGRFGQVHKCAEVSSGLVLAAKIIKVKCSKDREEVKNEIGVMNQLNHVNLIQLYDAYESKNSLTLIMEYVDGGELFDRIIDENYHLTELDAIVFARQICEGVQYLHQQYILHLDLKPENILCVNNTGNQIKIIDFGLARRYKPREKLKVNFGTPEFLAPEVVNYDFVSFATDMWSVGVITYMLLSGLSPFLGDNDTETMNSILHGNWDFDAEAFENISAEAKDFISRLLVPEKSNRMSAAGCLKHDWLNNLADKAKRCQVRLKSQLLLQSYLAHRQWKKHFYAVAAANRLRKFHQRRTMNLV